MIKKSYKKIRKFIIDASGPLFLVLISILLAIVLISFIQIIFKEEHKIGFLDYLSLGLVIGTLSVFAKIWHDNIYERYKLKVKRKSIVWDDKSVWYNWVGRNDDRIIYINYEDKDLYRFKMFKLDSGGREELIYQGNTSKKLYKNSNEVKEYVVKRCIH